MFCGWYIKYLQDNFMKERESMRHQEEKGDEQLIEIVRATSSALIEMKTALAEQTATMRELIGRLK